MLLFLGSLSNDNVRSQISNNKTNQTAITWEVKAEDRSPSQTLCGHPHCTFGFTWSVQQHSPPPDPTLCQVVIS